MKEDRFSRLIAILQAAKVRPDKLSDEWVYQRAWNDALDLAINKANAISGEDHGSQYRR